MQDGDDFFDGPRVLRHPRFRRWHRSSASIGEIIPLTATPSVSRGTAIARHRAEATMAKKAAKDTKKAAKRELIDTGTDKRFVRRGAKGQFNESDDVGKSLAQDRHEKARTKVTRGSPTESHRHATRSLATLVASMCCRDEKVVVAAS